MASATRSWQRRLGRSEVGVGTTLAESSWGGTRWRTFGLSNGICKVGGRSLRWPWWYWNPGSRHRGTSYPSSLWRPFWRPSLVAAFRCSQLFQRAWFCDTRSLGDLWAKDWRNRNFQMPSWDCFEIVRAKTGLLWSYLNLLYWSIWYFNDMSIGTSTFGFQELWPSMTIQAPLVQVICSSWCQIGPVVGHLASEAWGGGHHVAR